MSDILNYFGIGGFLFLILTVFVEISPIKINPIQWLGKRLNSSLLQKLEKVEKKLDNHVAQSLRSKILNYQNSLLNNQIHTHEEWSEILKACEDYEEYCKANNIKNGYVDHAIKYINSQFDKALYSNQFTNLPN